MLQSNIYINDDNLLAFFIEVLKSLQTLGFLVRLIFPYFSTPFGSLNVG